MGIYSATNGSILDATMDENMKPALESANYTAMALEVCAEAESNYNKIMKVIGIQELNFFEENGQEVIYEAGGIGGFFATIKKFFVNLWNKVKEIFHKFFVWLGSLSKSHKDFAKKYEKEARQRWNNIKDEFTIQGYKFTNLEGVDSKYTDMANNGIEVMFKGHGNVTDIKNFNTALELTAIKKMYEEDGPALTAAVKDFKENNSDHLEEARGAVFAALSGKDRSKLTAEEFTKELFEYFRDGESSKSTLEKGDGIELETILTELKTYDKTKSEAEKAFKSFKKDFETAIKVLEQSEKDANKLGGKDNKFDATSGRVAYSSDPGDTTDVYDKNGKEARTEEERKAALNKENRTGDLIYVVSSMTSAAKAVKEMTVTVNGAFLQALKDRANQDKIILAKIVTTGKVNKESADYGTTYSESAAAGTLDYLANVQFN